MKSKTAQPAAIKRLSRAQNPTKPVPALLSLVCRALDEKLAGEVRVLRVADQSSITDFLVIATGTSEPHLRALRVELEKVIDATGTRIIGMDTGEVGSGWLVIDAFDVMIHVLTKENRALYSLEKLWEDADEIPVSMLLGKAKPAAASLFASVKEPRAKAPAKKAAPAKTKVPAKTAKATKAKAPAAKTAKVAKTKAAKPAGKPASKPAAKAKSTAKAKPAAKAKTPAKKAAVRSKK